MDEIAKIADGFGLPFAQVERKDTTRLTLARDKIIRSQIVAWHTFADELMNQELSKHFFVGSGRNVLRRRSYRLFKRHILEEMGFAQKLNYVAELWVGMPAIVRDRLQKLNSVRNVIVHSFFPEDRIKSKPRYKGLDVFSMAGIAEFGDDIHEAEQIFHRHLRRYLRK